MQITDLKFKNNLNALNREPKNVVLAYCLSNDWKSSNDIRNSYLSTVESKALAPTCMTFREYCHNSFLPSRFVQESILPVEQVLCKTVLVKYSNHWRFTDYGIHTAKPAALLGLETAKEFQTSLYEILGRIPYNRAKILMHLSKVKNAREKDLAEVTESNPIGVFHNCEKLASLGFIDYDSCFEKGWAEYEWSGKEGQPKAVGHILTLTKEVADFMRENSGRWNYESLSKEMGKNPTVVSSVLSGLEKQGFAKKLKNFKVKEKQSEAKIRDTGIEFTEMFLNPIYEASDPNAGRGYLEDFTQGLTLSTEDVVKQVRNYYRISPNLNIIPTSATEALVVELVKEAPPSGLRPRDIIAKTGKNLNDHLRSMSNRGLLIKKREGKAALYSLPETE